MIHNFLKKSYWAENVSKATIETSINNSLCFGIYENNKQVGFARVISDYATSALVQQIEGSLSTVTKVSKPVA